MWKILLVTIVFSCYLVGCDERTQQTHVPPQTEVSQEKLEEQQQLLDKLSRSYEMDISDNSGL